MSATKPCPDTAPAESRIRLNRTCTACRQRKIKCKPLAQELDARDTDACTRCWKLSLNCVFPPSARKKTRRRNEDKIRDLESRLEAVQAAVESGLGLESPPGRVTASTLPDETPQRASLEEILGAPVGPPGDPLTVGLVSPEMAEKLYRTFIDDLAPLYPLVSVAASCTWQSTRRERPALFRAILTAASISAEPDISATMFRGTAQFLAEKVVVAGEKSLDLIQALLVLSAWHLPPSTFGELKFSQYAHMAATMVIDLRSSNNRHYAIPTADQTSPPSHELVETCRTFLATYFLCSSMAMSYRRPTNLPYGPWVEDCIRTLEVSPDAQLNDRRLVQWVKLHRIAEESLLAAYGDREWLVDVLDARTRYIFKACLESLETWRRSMPAEIINSTLEMHYQTINLVLREPALYDEHSVSDFRPPYVLRPLPLRQQDGAALRMQAADSLIPCILSSQSLIRTFLGHELETLRFMPVITYTRVAYALIVLIKCFCSARFDIHPGEGYYDPSLDPAGAIRQLMDKLESVKNQPDIRLLVPTVFHSILSKIHMWYHRVYTLSIALDTEDLMEPMMHLSLQDDKRAGNARVDSCKPTVEQHAEAPSHLVLQEGTFGCEEFEWIGDVRFDTSASDPWEGFPDPLGYLSVIT